MSGHLAVVGLGPGDARWLTPEADAALARAEALYGYAGYLDRIPSRPGQARHPSDNHEEAARAAASLHAAAAGAEVAIVTGGDPGVFAIAAAVCAEIEAGPESFRQLEVTITPGISAMLAVAARAGAPLANDFCAISLSDNLKPWELIERTPGVRARFDLGAHRRGHGEHAGIAAGDDGDVRALRRVTERCASPCSLFAVVR